MAQNSIEIASKLDDWEKCFALFHQQQESGELCDVTIVSEGRKINAHKLVLSSRSPFFRSMFTTQMKEANMNEIHIPDISYETMDQIIQFIYTSQLLISTETVQNVIIAASYLQMAPLVNFCGHYVIKRIDEDNCLAIRELLGSTICDKDLVERANSYINSNFLKIVQNESFFQLGVDDAVELLSRSELCYMTENDVLQAATKWLTKTNSFDKHSERILQCVRPTLLPGNANEYNFEGLSNNQLKSPRTLKTSLMALYRDDEDKSFKLYDSSTKQFTKTITIRAKKFYHEAVSDDYIFMSGTDDRDLELYFEVYNRKTKSVTSTPSLDYHGGFSNMVTVGNNLYVFKQSNTEQTTLHIYSTDTNMWFTGPEPSFHCEFSQFIALDKCIYVFGNAFDRRIRKLDTETKLWSDVPSMRKNDEHLSLTTYKGKIYAIGGTYDNCTSFEAYDPLKNEWIELKNLPKCQPDEVIGVSDGIYVYGRDEFDDNVVNASYLDFYDVVRDEWSVEEGFPTDFKGAALLAGRDSYFN